jgi:hypothetical protein
MTGAIFYSVIDNEHYLWASGAYLPVISGLYSGIVALFQERFVQNYKNRVFLHNCAVPKHCDG